MAEMLALIDFEQRKLWERGETSGFQQCRMLILVL
jgi:hypothetical protein